MDGGLWVSPHGRVYAVEDGHLDFILDHFDLFGFSDEDEEIFLTLEPYMQEDFMIQHALRKGWARIRFCASDIFISAVRSPRVDRLLSKVAEAILECGYPLTSIAKVQLLEDAGDYLSVPHSYYSASEETLQSLIAASYTPLYSGQSCAIFSMAGGFANADLIMNLKRNVLEFLQKSRHVSASWTFNESVSNEQTTHGWLLNWDSTLTISNKPHKVVFVQNGDLGDLTVLVGTSRLTISRFGRFNSKFVTNFLKALENDK